ncbi:MAG: hypothetical protein ACFNLR_09625, partial [Prevotella denticola]
MLGGPQLEEPGGKPLVEAGRQRLGVLETSPGTFLTRSTEALVGQVPQQEVISSLEGVSADLGQAYISLQNAQNSLSAAETALTSAETTLAEKEREQQIATDRLTTAQNSLDAVKQEADASKKTASETSDSVGEIV